MTALLPFVADVASAQVLAPPRPPAASVPDPPARDTRLDIVRGWLQVTIFVSHAATTWLHGWLVYGAWGLSDSSEQFVFLSGYVLGSVFARRAARLGWVDAARDMLRRALLLYRTELVLFTMFGAMVVLADRSGLRPGEIERLGWDVMLRDPVHAIPAALAMLYLPSFMDILPLFVWGMLLLPGFAALERALGPFALLAPFALYAGVQFAGLQPPFLDGHAGTGFNPFAWQMLFLLGAFLGRRVLLTGRKLPVMPWLTEAAVMIIVAGVALRLGWYGVLPWAIPVSPDLPVFDRRGLGLAVVVHALALAWLVSHCVPRHAAWMGCKPLRWLAAAGRQSLQVFCLGLFLSWATDTAIQMWPAWWLEPLVIAAGVAALLYFAWQTDRRRPTSRTAPANPAAACAAAKGSRASAVRL